MDTEARAAPLIDCLYEAVAEPAHWHEFVAKLSEAFGGAAVALGVELPGNADPPLSFLARLSDRHSPAFARHFLEDRLPWGDLEQAALVRGFVHTRELFPDEKLPETTFYQEWMEPQGLAPEGPLAHTIAIQADRPVAGIAIYRTREGRPFDDEDLAVANALVPHLARAYALFRRFGAVQRRSAALALVIDRSPLGIVLVDRALHTVTANRNAERIAALRDGFEFDSIGPRATDPRTDAALRELLERGSRAREALGPDGVLSIPRPSGRPAFGAMVWPLPAEVRRSWEATAVLFVADPDAGHVSTCEVLQALYSLTPAEAELVRILAEGPTLARAADLRGVTLNTARTQLKQVFAKTGTKRQGELVRLILTGVATLRDD